MPLRTVDRHARHADHRSTPLGLDDASQPNPEAPTQAETRPDTAKHWTSGAESAVSQEKRAQNRRRVPVPHRIQKNLNDSTGCTYRRTSTRQLPTLAPPEYLVNDTILTAVGAHATGGGAAGRAGAAS